jgi:hypothetical protein
MAAYERTSRFGTFAEVHAPLRDEAQRVATKQSIGDLGGAARFTVETHVRRTTAPGFFTRLTGLGDRDPEHWQVVVLTRDAVLAGVHGIARGTTVFFLPLATLQVDDMAGAGPEVYGSAIALSSPSLSHGGGVGSYVVHFDSLAARDRVLEAIRGALAERRAG